jgi:hypothetical protein
LAAILRILGQAGLHHSVEQRRHEKLRRGEKRREKERKGEKRREKERKGGSRSRMAAIRLALPTS